MIRRHAVLLAAGAVALAGCSTPTSSSRAATSTTPAASTSAWAETSAGAAPRIDRSVAHPKGLMTTLEVDGLDKRLEPLEVWLPPQYFGKDRATHLPVLLALAAMHGTGGTLERGAHIEDVALTETAKRATKPFIIVYAPSRIDFDVDSECVDLPGIASQSFYPKVLVPAVHAAFDTAEPGHGWYVTGFSTGGQCAALLQARQAGTFTASVAMAGYFTPLYDAAGKALATDELTAQNSPLAMVRAGTLKRLDLLAVFATGDAETYGHPDHQAGEPDGRDFHDLAQGLPGLSFLLFDGMRHAITTYNPHWPAALQWLGKRGL